MVDVSIESEGVMVHGECSVCESGECAGCAAPVVIGWGLGRLADLLLACQKADRGVGAAARAIDACRCGDIAATAEWARCAKLALVIG